jgi:hypothetical protein
LFFFFGGLDDKVGMVTMLLRTWLSGFFTGESIDLRTCLRHEPLRIIREHMN